MVNSGILILVSLILGQSQSGGTGRPINDRSLAGLVGPVRAVRVETQSTLDKNGVPKEETEIDEIAVYDRDGFISERYDFVRSCLRSRHEFRLEADGQSTEKVFWGPLRTRGSEPSADPKAYSVA